MKIIYFQIFLLPDLMAMDYWDSKSNTIVYDKNVFNSETQKWVKSAITQKSFKDFKKILEFNQDFDTGFACDFCKA